MSCCTDWKDAVMYMYIKEHPSQPMTDLKFVFFFSFQTNNFAFCEALWQWPFRKC